MGKLINRRPWQRRAGFTLVELLVVIGIIALLMSILLPTLGRVKEQANRIKCNSQLRQIGVAMIMYTDRNKDFFPYASSVGGGPRLEDWIYWQTLPTRRDVSESAIAPYMGGDKESLAKMLRCPSDELVRPVVGAGGPYEYSYTMNYRMGANGGTPVVKRTKIRHQAQKVLMIEENDRVDDGRWVWPGNSLGTWHEKPERRNNDQAEGGCLFVDGHVGLLNRLEANSQLFCDPYWSPP